MSELEMLRARVELLREAHTLANTALRSAWQIAERDGCNTNWAGHREQLRASLDASHAAMAALNSSPAYDCAAQSTNASLIAELLTALKAVVAVADRKTTEFDLARAAISKAEGERPA